jgi:hypothetical protein
MDRKAFGRGSNAFDQPEQKTPRILQKSLVKNFTTRHFHIPSGGIGRL